MNVPLQSSVTELMADHSLITEAVRRAVQEAVLKHAQAGHPVAIWQDGQVVWIQPADILARQPLKPAS